MTTHKKREITKKRKTDPTSKYYSTHITEDLSSSSDEEFQVVNVVEDDDDNPTFDSLFTFTKRSEPERVTSPRKFIVPPNSQTKKKSQTPVTPPTPSSFLPSPSPNLSQAARNFLTKKKKPETPSIIESPPHQRTKHYNEVSPIAMDTIEEDEERITEDAVEEERPQAMDIIQDEDPIQESSIQDDIDTFPDEHNNNNNNNSHVEETEELSEDSQPSASSSTYTRPSNSASLYMKQPVNKFNVNNEGSKGIVSKIRDTISASTLHTQSIAEDFKVNYRKKLIRGGLASRLQQLVQKQKFEFNKTNRGNGQNDIYSNVSLAIQFCVLDIKQIKFSTAMTALFGIKLPLELMQYIKVLIPADKYKEMDIQIGSNIILYQPWHLVLETSKAPVILTTPFTPFQIQFENLSMNSVSRLLYNIDSSISPQDDLTLQLPSKSSTDVNDDDVAMDINDTSNSKILTTSITSHLCYTTKSGRLLSVLHPSSIQTDSSSTLDFFLRRNKINNKTRILTQCTLKLLDQLNCEVSIQIPDSLYFKWKNKLVEREGEWISIDYLRILKNSVYEGTERTTIE